MKSPLSSNVLILKENVLDGKQSYEVKVEVRMQGKALFTCLLSLSVMTYENQTNC